MGAIPIIIDVDTDYFQIDESKIEKVISAKTKAIIPVHLFGQAGNLNELIAIARKYQIAVIEDTAQALGSWHKDKSLGTIGDIGCTSFFPTKNLACFGDGGAIFTNNDDLAKRIRMIANHGQKVKYEHEMVGVNSRLDTLQAAILSVKLKHLENNISKKAVLAEAYYNELKDCVFIKLPIRYIDNKHSWHQFTIQVSGNKRDKLRDYLKLNGIESMIYYPKVLYYQNAYIKFLTDTPNASQLCETVLSLPIHPFMQITDVAIVCNHIRDFFNAKS